MKSLVNKFTVEREDLGPIEIALGELYIILRDYRARNVGDFEDNDILVAMPIAITDKEVWLFAICMDCTHGIYVSGNEGETLIATMDDDYQRHAKLSPIDLKQILIQMPMREQQVVMVGEWEVETWVMAMHCVKADFINMNIVPIGIKLTDLRQWPKSAISWWARDHLRLSPEQLQTINGFNERWKMISYAQEVFTYHCADFNPTANKKMKDKQEELKRQEIARMMAQLENKNMVHADWIIDLGHPGFIIPNMDGPHNLDYNFEDPDTGRRHAINLVKSESPEHREIHITVYVDGNSRMAKADHDDLRDEDLCAFLIDGYVLHVLRESPRDRGLSPRAGSVRLAHQAMRAMPRPVDPDERIRYDDRGRPMYKGKFIDPRDRGKRIKHEMNHYKIEGNPFEDRPERKPKAPGLPELPDFWREEENDEE